VTPGAELLAAVQGSAAIGAQLVLADRDIQITLKRTWANISSVNKLRLVTSLLAAPFAAAELSEDQIEQLKNRDTISEMLAELSRMVPGLKEPLIDERDQYLASSIQMAPGQTLVVVVGAGHVEGVIAQLDSVVDRRSLEQLPTVSVVNRFRRWALPVLVAGVLYFGWYTHASSGLVHMLTAWIVSTGLGCALLTASAGARPLAVVAGFLSAPVVTLYPRTSAGLLPALVQAALRRPTQAHCASILESIATLRGWYRNPATRLLLVYLLSALGASLGAVIGAVWMICLL
jgi:pheromone shutdown-related protein TraB